MKLLFLPYELSCVFTLIIAFSVVVAYYLNSYHNRSQKKLILSVILYLPGSQLHQNKAHLFVCVNLSSNGFAGNYKVVKSSINEWER